MDSKDAAETVETGGGGRYSGSQGRRRVAAALVLQSLLTAMCAAISLHIFFNQNSGSNDKGIFMEMINAEDLKFSIFWNQSVDLKLQKNLTLPCGGPYMVYLWACVRSFKDTNGTANLTMHQGNKSVHLQTMQGSRCLENQSVVMLSEKRDVTFNLIQSDIEIQKLQLGLHYMLGTQCPQH